MFSFGQAADIFPWRRSRQDTSRSNDHLVAAWMAVDGCVAAQCADLHRFTAYLQHIYSLPVLQSRRVWLIESKWQVPSTSMSVAQPNQKIIIKIPKIIIESKHIQKSYQILLKFAELISHMMFTPFCDLPVSFGMVLLSEKAVVVIEAAT
jgi:hypothetical protein